MSNVQNLEFMIEILYLKGKARMLVGEEGQAELRFLQARQT